MKSLLVIGAGGHGQVVYEIAKSLGYERIEFLDDNNDAAIGKIEEMDQFLDYKEAFCGIGNNHLRDRIIRKLLDVGYQVPTLIHPAAYVSPSAKIHAGVVVEPMAIVNTRSVLETGAIISAGSIVDHNVHVGRCAHVDAGAIVKSGGQVEDYEKLEAGEVRLGYTQTIVAK